MTRHTEPLDFSRPERAEGEAQLVVDLGGFEGPLDLLLELARRQKVDLAHISILALAEQFLAFIAEARRMRLELAADYLVMAAWLAFLKSRLLLPGPGPNAEPEAVELAAVLAAWLAYLKSRLLLPGPAASAEPEAVELAAVLAERLQRLEAIRRAAQRLGARERLGIDVFARGAPEPVVVHHAAAWQVDLQDLIGAYLDRRRHQAASHVSIAKRAVWSLQQAREMLERLMGRSLDWAPIDAFLAGLMLDAQGRRSARASAFAASLELAREGLIDLRQERPFAPLYARKRPPAAGVAAGAAA